MRFIHLDTVGSTQTEARNRLDVGETGPLWVRADSQTDGRGRRGRAWSSPSGNLFATALLPTTLDAARSALVGFAAALAIADTLETYGIRSGVTLKWPNDVLIGGAKISGILIEREGSHLLVGIGMNLVSHPSDTPYPATDLLSEMTDEDLQADEPMFTGPEAVLATLSAHLMGWIDRLERDGFSPLREAWLAKAHRLGEAVSVNGLTGTLSGMGPDGSLELVLPDGAKTRVHAGDVSFG